MEVNWRHEMTFSLDVAMGSGFARAQARAWDSSEQSVADFRGIVLGTHVIANALRSTPAYLFDGQQGNLFDTPNSNYRGAWHEAVGTALLQTLCLLSRGASPTNERIRSRDGEAAVADSDAGLTWPAVVVIVAGIAAATVAICYLGEKASPVIDRDLTRSQAGTNLVAVHAQMAALAADHANREAAAGQSLPPSPLEIAALAALHDSQKVFLQPAVDPAAPPKEPPPLAHTLGLGAIAALTAIALFWITLNSRR